MVQIRVWGVTTACLGLEKPRDRVVSSVLPARALLIERRLWNTTDVAVDGNNKGTVIGKKRRSQDTQPCGRTRMEETSITINATNIQLHTQSPMERKARKVHL